MTGVETMETFALAAVKQWQTSCGLNEAEMEAFILFFLKTTPKIASFFTSKLLCTF